MLEKAITIKQISILHTEESIKTQDKFVNDLTIMYKTITILMSIRELYKKRRRKQKKKENLKERKKKKL